MKQGTKVIIAMGTRVITRNRPRVCHGCTPASTPPMEASFSASVMRPWEAALSSWEIWLVVSVTEKAM